MSVLDVFVTCNKILPFITRMKIDERREKTLSNFSAVKTVGRVIETDHNPLYLELKLEFSPAKPERIEIFQFKNKASQAEFFRITSKTDEFTRCFDDNMSFEKQAGNWRKTLTTFFHKAF
jgi:hypothetical protein